MEPLPATTQAPHPAPPEPVIIAGGQALNDRGQRDRTGIDAANRIGSV